MPEKRQPTVFDTGQQYLGSIYAKALLGATEKSGQTEQVLAELDSLVDDILENAASLDETLASPRVPLEAKERILDRAFSGQMTPSLLVFLKVVCRRGRFDCMRAIRRAAREQYNELRGRVEVQVAAPGPLDAETQQLVEARLRATLGQDVDLTVRVDPGLIGGLVVRVGDTVYDGSVANRLSRLRHSMVSKAWQEIRGDVDRFARVEE